MYQLLYPIKDSTIYSYKPLLNTGKDQLVEIYKVVDHNDYNFSRILMQFDFTYISASIANGTIISPKFYLNMYISMALNQREYTNLYIYPMSSSWTEGLGTFSELVDAADGVTWEYRKRELSIPWANSGSDYLPTVTTASLWKEENIYQSTGIYGDQVSDLNIDITSMVMSWISGSVPNNGFIIKRDSNEELDIESYGNVSFYSKDTHTIFSPRIHVVWDNALFITGSLQPIDVNDTHLYTRNMKEKYNWKEKSRIYLGARAKYPSSSFSVSNKMQLDKYIPSSSYYCIIDSITNSIFIPFDTDGTKVSCDANGNYLNLSFDGFYPERFYSIRVKMVSGSIENIIDLPIPFKVIK